MNNFNNKSLYSVLIPTKTRCGEPEVELKVFQRTHSQKCILVEYTLVLSFVKVLNSFPNTVYPNFLAEQTGL